MSQQKKTKQELEEMFENFLFSIDDYIENISEKSEKLSSKITARYGKPITTFSMERRGVCNIANKALSS